MRGICELREKKVCMRKTERNSAGWMYTRAALAKLIEKTPKERL